MKYLKKFDTSAEFEAAYDGTGYTEPWTSLSPTTMMTIAAGEDIHATYIGVFYYAGEPGQAYVNQGYWKVWQSVDEGDENFFPLDEHASMPEIGDYLPYEGWVENGMITDLHGVGVDDYNVANVTEIPGKVTYNKKGVHHKIYLIGDCPSEIGALVWSMDTGETTITCEDLEDITMAYACDMQNEYEGGNMYYYFLRYRRTSPEYGKEWWPYSPSYGFLDNYFFAYCDDDEVKIVSNPE